MVKTIQQVNVSYQNKIINCLNDPSPPKTVVLSANI